MRTHLICQSENRVNVALSRAKHGMYIMGNAAQLASQSDMWATITHELSESGAIGDGWPIACARHPETRRYAKKPGDIQQLSPDGEWGIRYVSNTDRTTGDCHLQW